MDEEKRSCCHHGLKDASALMSWEFLVSSPLAPCSYLYQHYFPSRVKSLLSVRTKDTPDPAPHYQGGSCPLGKGDTSKPQLQLCTCTFSGLSWWRVGCSQPWTWVWCPPALSCLWISSPRGSHRGFLYQGLRAEWDEDDAG